MIDLDSKKFGGSDVYIIPANYSGWYVSREYDMEHKLNYYTEDIGLNAFYFYLRLNFPFWLKSEEFGLPKSRGEEYLYSHKLLIARYNLERLSNDVGKIEDFDWHNEFYTGYYPTMTFRNGLPLPQRPYWSKFPYYKYKYLKVRFKKILSIFSLFLCKTTKIIFYLLREIYNLLIFIIYIYYRL